MDGEELSNFYQQIFMVFWCTTRDDEGCAWYLLELVASKLSGASEQ